MLNFAINNETIQGGVPIPLLTNNPYIEDMSVMAESSLTESKTECQVVGKCACGCGGDIILQPHHKYYGIPKYLSGHSSRINPIWKGKKLSTEHVEKLRESHEGFRLSDEHKKKIGDAQRGRPGKPTSLETRRKQSKSKGMEEYIIDDVERARAKSIRANTVRRSTPAGRLRHSMSESIRQSLKNGKEGRALRTLLPYSIEQLKKHLEKQFKPRMTWDNYGEWHIDHKIPISTFNFTSPDHIDFKRCWALKNLQPMWAKDNFKKGDKLDMPFQPCLELLICE